MRWVVELPAPSGGTAATVTVEADSWAGALTRARGGISVKKFRCEFEEDGVVRVNDLDTRQRYTVRPLKAPVDRASTAITVASSETESIASEPPPGLSYEPASAVDAPAEGSGLETSPGFPVPVASMTPAGTTVDPAPSGLTPASPVARTVDLVASTEAPSALVAYPPSTVPVAGPIALRDAHGAAAGVNGLATAHAAEPGASSASIPPTEPLPIATLLFERDQDPSASNPLVYRERVFAVPDGTRASQAEQLARQALAALRRTLTSHDRGRFVTVAVFDHVFASHPARPPLAVLRWKDWRGEPEVSFPTSLPVSQSIPAGPSVAPPPGPVAEGEAGSVMPTLGVVDEALDGPPLDRLIVEPRSESPPDGPLAAGTLPPEPATPSLAATGGQPSNSGTETASRQTEGTQGLSVAPGTTAAHASEGTVETAAHGAPSLPVPPAALVIEPEPVRSPEARTAGSEPSVPMEREGGRGRSGRKRKRTPADRVPTDSQSGPALTGSSPAEPDVAVDTREASPQPEAEAVVPPTAAVVPASPTLGTDVPVLPSTAVAAAATTVATRSPTLTGTVVETGRPTVRLRKRGSDLLSDLFDALMDLAFLQEAQEACDFTARVLREHVASDAGVVLLYDIDRDELVVVSAEGAASLRNDREKINHGPRGRSVLRLGPVALPLAEGVVGEEVPAGPLLCVPVFHNQRLFAVVELRRNPGGEEYASDEQDAVVYVAAQLGEYLSHHSRRVAIREHATSDRR